MKRFRTFFVVLTLALPLFCLARDKKDTLFSQGGDRVILSYSVSRSGDRVTVQFMNVQKKLGQRSAKQFKKLDEVKVLFFDRTGNYPDVSFTDMVPKAFMVPAALQYEASSDGYFFVEDNPRVQFTATTGDDTQVQVPVFLAHYEKKGRYRIFAQCGQLNLSSGRRSAGGNRQNGGTETVQVPVTETMEVGEGLEGPEAEVLECIGMVKQMLALQESLPFSDGLVREISRLDMLKMQTRDPELVSRINETIMACEQRKKELGDKASADQQAAQQAAEAKAAAAQQAALARQDSLQAVAEKKAEEQKKQNIWLIIGAAILGILGFSGNQVMQHLRNAKSQKSFMEMQQNMVKQAQNEAKRRAESKLRQAKSKVLNEGKRSVRKTINLGEQAVKNQTEKTRKAAMDALRESAQRSKAATAGKAVTPPTATPEKKDPIVQPQKPVMPQQRPATTHPQRPVTNPQQRPAITPTQPPAKTPQQRPATTQPQRPTATPQHRPTATPQHRPAATPQRPASNPQRPAPTPPKNPDNQSNGKDNIRI